MQQYLGESYTVGPFYAPISPPKWVRFARRSPQMFVLSPATNAMFVSQQHAHGNDFAKTVIQQTAFGGVMNVCLHNKRIRPNFIDSVGAKFVAFSNDGEADLFERLRLQQANRISQRLVMKACFIKTAEPHDGSQFAMLFGEVLQLIVSVIATKTNGRQHADVPVVHALATCVST